MTAKKKAIEPVEFERSPAFSASLTNNYTTTKNHVKVGNRAEMRSSLSLKITPPDECVTRQFAVPRGGICANSDVALSESSRIGPRIIRKY